MKKIKFLFLNISLSILGIALALLSIEVGTRFFHIWYVPDYSVMNWYMPSPIAHVPYVMKPNLDARWGLGEFKSKEWIRDLHEFQKDEGTFRILALGDSITFGYGVDQTQSFPAALEKLLRSNQTKKFEVINAGLPGLNIVDESYFAEALVEKYKPDVVIWTTFVNDYDDSLGVSPEGSITFSNVDYVVTEDSLLNWRHRQPVIDPANLFSSMTVESQNWALGTPQPSSLFSPVHSWLGSHSVLYAWIKSRIPYVSGPKQDKSNRRVTYIGQYDNHDNKQWLWPPFSPIFSSRHAIHRANEGMSRVAGLSARTNTPVVVFNTGLPLDKKWREPIGVFRVEEASAYLPEPFNQFLENNNLGWDSHFSVEGNKKFAEAIYRLLGCRGFIKNYQECDQHRIDDAYNYWDAFDEARSNFVKDNYRLIDLDHFMGLHQVLGGVFPPRVFPGHLAKRANFLLPAQSGGTLWVKGMLPGAEKLQVKMTVFSGSVEKSADFIAEPGEVALHFDLFDVPLPKDNIVEVQLVCISEHCPSLHLGLLKIE